MRFNSDAYEKCFPPVKEVEKVESVVDSFKPTEEALKASAEEAHEDVANTQNDSEGGEDGDRQLDNIDSE